MRRIAVDRIVAAPPAVVAEAPTPMLRRFSFSEPPLNFYGQALTRMLNGEKVSSAKSPGKTEQRP